MFCKFCGNQMNDNSEVCPACGKPVGVNVAPAKPVQPSVPYAAPVAPVAPVAADEPKKGKKAKKAPKDPSAKKKGGKKIIIAVIALVLVAAIAAGALFIFQNPAVQVMNAAQKTIFESSEIKITVRPEYSGDIAERYEGCDNYAEIELVFGENIDESSMKIKSKSEWLEFGHYEYVYDEYDDYYGYYYDDYYYGGHEEWVEYDEPQKESYETSFEYKNGKLYEDGEKYDEDLEELAKYGEENLKENLGVDIDIIDVANMIIQGKLSEDGLADVFNTVLVPNIEKVLKDEYDIEIDLPEFEGVTGNVTSFIKKAYENEAITLEKAKSSRDGKTYEYKIDTGDLIACLLEYAQEEEDLNKYLEEVVRICKDKGYDEISSVDELIDFLDDELDVNVEIKGELTIKSGRITYISIEPEDSDMKLIIEIESKK